MSCKELGYEVGDKFNVINKTPSAFNVGVTVELSDDDGSEMPRFKDESGREKWLYLSSVEKINTTKTLLEILVDELPKHGGWPEGADSARQDAHGEILFDLQYSGVKLSKIAIDASVNMGTFINEGKVTRDQYESALAEKNDGWIKWEGGECPVDEDTMVVARLRNGDIWLGGDAVMAKNLDWSNEESSLDVIAYRLSKPEEIAKPEDFGAIGDGEEAPYVTVESLTDAIIDYGCEANLAYPLAKHLLASGLIK